MQLFPTRPATEITLTGVFMIATGVVLRQPAIVGWAGALLFGVAVARAATVLSVSRVRAAGLEMLWRATKRSFRTVRGAELTLSAELRNRDPRAVRFTRLRPVASSQLVVRVEPERGEIPGGGRVPVTLVVETPRIGHHGIHGLALELEGQPGLFEVPLAFGNPLGIEVLPRPYGTLLATARGGRSRLGAETGRPTARAGEGTDLRELREHVPGDPFKRIAWKASAKRGKLLVRDFERDERDVAWLVLDGSVELWAGPIGRAPLDRGIDELSALAQRHAERGDRVGLAVIGSRVRLWLTPERGPAQAMRIATALANAASLYDYDRSDLDEGDVARRVYEHMCAIDPGTAGSVERRDLDAIEAKANALKRRAPFEVPVPNAGSARERSLRHYMACFGLDAPPRLTPDRPHADRALLTALLKIAKERPRPSLVYVWSPAPSESEAAPLASAVRRLARRAVAVEWIAAEYEPALTLPLAPRKSGEVPDAQTDANRIAVDAALLRAKIARLRGERVLRQAGIHPTRPRIWPSARG